MHHAIARLLQEEEGVTGLANSVNFDDDIGPGTFMEWAVGKEGEIFPDPRQWVGNGSRTVDEMAHAWVDVTYLEQDEYEQMLAERERRRSWRTTTRRSGAGAVERR